MTPYMAGFVGIIAFLFLLAFRMPIAVAMAITGFWGFSYITTYTAALRVISSDLYTTMASYSLSVIPMFILMGYFAFQAGIGTKLYNFAYKAFGHMSGGLAMASIAACAVFGAVCGSATATAATIGSIAIPEMKKYDYHPSLYTACVAAGGGMGLLIPPSTIFVIYGIQTEQSIARLFLSGIIPGILLAVMYMIMIWLLTRRNPALGPPKAGPRASFKEVMVSLTGGIIEVGIVFIISIGGLFLGLFTPTEAGAVGAAGVLLVSIIFGRTLNLQKFNLALADTTRTSAMILFLIAGAMIFSRFMVVSRLPSALAEFIHGLTVHPVLIMLLILFVYIFFGTFIEIIPLILITVPIFYPIVVNILGYDPIWFGVIIVVVAAVGVITPPVGVNVFVLKGIASDVPLETIFSGVWPFVLTAVVLVLILMAFPGIALFLPNLLLP